jgi:hypothetical protein
MVRLRLVALVVLLFGTIHVDFLPAQEMKQLKPGVVKITAKAQDVTKVGTGFIVRLEKDDAYIVQPLTLWGVIRSLG